MPTVIATVGDSITDDAALECDIVKQRYWPNLLGDALGPSYQVLDFGLDGIPAAAYRYNPKHQGVLRSRASIVTISAPAMKLLPASAGCCDGVTS